MKAVGLGAYDFYQKPVDVDTLQLIVQRAYRIHELEAENRRLLEALGTSPLDGVIAASDAMLKVCRMIEKVAPTNATTLLQGESGTGKEVLARAIHSLSRAHERAVRRDQLRGDSGERCSNPSSSASRRARSPARSKQTPGKIEVADGGTLFLDEIGDMPLALQAKLLRFLQERTVERVGGRARDSRRRARGLRDQQESARGDGDERVPRRPVLPNQRDHDRDSARSRARRRPHPARAALAQQVREAAGRATSRASPTTRTTRSTPTRGPATSARWRTRSRPR